MGPRAGWHGRKVGGAAKPASWLRGVRCSQHSMLGGLHSPRPGPCLAPFSVRRLVSQGSCPCRVDMALGSVGTKQYWAWFASCLSLDGPQPRQHPQKVLRTRWELDPSCLICETSISSCEAGAWSLQPAPCGMRPDAHVTLSRARRAPLHLPSLRPLANSSR